MYDDSGYYSTDAHIVSILAQMEETKIKNKRRYSEQHLVKEKMSREFSIIFVLREF